MKSLDSLCDDSWWMMKVSGSNEEYYAVPRKATSDQNRVMEVIFMVRIDDDSVRDE